MGNGGAGRTFKERERNMGVNSSDSIKHTIRADSIVSPIGALIKSIFDPHKVTSVALAGRLASRWPHVTGQN